MSNECRGKMMALQIIGNDKIQNNNLLYEKKLL